MMLAISHDFEPAKFLATIGARFAQQKTTGRLKRKPHFFEVEDRFARLLEKINT